MKFIWKLLLICLCFLLVTGAFMPKAAFSITAAEEEELSREFMKVILKSVKFVEDPVIVNYVNKIGKWLWRKNRDKLFPYLINIIDNNRVFNKFDTFQNNLHELS